MLDPHQSLAAALADRYRFERALGAGGMATVYLATDLKHDRDVAVKVLHPELAATIGRDRFVREIDIAAHFTHPNILPVFDSGQANGFLYYVMPHVEGESLRQRLDRDGSLSVDETLRITHEVADALAYAHANGVVHRDVKPGNILFVAGHAVLADFGIGRALARRTTLGMTRPNLLLGTPQYMSPEQVNASAELDGRSDQYSLACTVWEMLAGEPAFEGDTPMGALASHLVDREVSLDAVRDDLPPGLVAAVEKGLARDPNDRFETVDAFAAALEKAAADAGRKRAVPTSLVAYLGGGWLLLQFVELLADQFLLPSWVTRGSLYALAAGLPVVLATAAVQAGFRWRPRRKRRGLRGVLTWQNAFTWGVVAFAVLGLVASAYAVSRALGVGPAATLVDRGELEKLDRIVLADLRSAPADSGLAHAVGLLLGVDLGRSPTVRIAGPTRVAETLRRMELDPHAPLDLALATEVARREGFEAVLGGELTRLGSSWLLAVQLQAAPTGEQLLAERATVGSPEELPAAVEELSERLRERIGEPLRSIRTGPPLARVTTASIEALRLYSEGSRAQRRDDYERAIALLEEAIEIDSTFAMAYRTLATVLFNSHRDPDRLAEVGRKAFELRDRLPTRERLRIEASRYRLRDPERAIELWETLLRRYPGELTAAVSLATARHLRGDHARAEDAARHAISLTDSTYWGAYSTTIAAQVAQGEWQEARITLERMAQKLPGDARMQEERVRLASARGDWAAAEAAAVPLLEAEGPGYETRLRGHEHMAGLEYVRGRLDSGDRHIAAIVEILEDAGVGTEVQRFVFTRALVHVLSVRDTAAALRMTRDILARYPLDPMDDPWTAVDLVRLWAATGQADEARALLDRIEVAFATTIEEGDRRLEVLLARARGYGAIAEGRYGDAVAELERGLEATGHLCYGMCVMPALARALEGAGRTDSAIAVYEAYIERPMLYRGRLDAFYRAPVYERLGELHAERGDRPEAASWYGRLFDLWEDADPALQPRLRAAEARLEELVGEPRELPPGRVP